MITKEEFENGMELVNKGGVFEVNHAKLGDGAITRVGNDIVFGMGALMISCDNVRLRNRILEFMKNGEVVASLNMESMIAGWI